MRLARKETPVDRDNALGLVWSDEAGACYIGDAVYARPFGDTVVLRTDRGWQHPRDLA